MSTITRELAKLFRKITNSEIDAEGNAHVVLSPADSLLINNARIALASLEAEAVACIDRANLDYLESGADADVWPASGAGSDDVLLYAAPQLPQPAVLSVPDEIPKLKDGMGFKYVKDGVRYSLNYANGWNACRAAMLQDGNSPVSPDGWIPVSERIPEAHEPVYIFHPDYGVDQGVWYDDQEDAFLWDSDCSRCRAIETVSHWMPMPAMPAAPQQEDL
ncbi:DUF551 domain-containing protein [Citrobacter freundii]|uniref:DUF551 domain-containing protein n=1 Tax=Citrobacter freundii TaxID=546 RepID=UPI00292AA829|nr:DUF551 domain-containing protein [Citrobacter freundii]MDV0655759.1 DUF551 domain-containing protein [Citrobacter freundii]MDV0721296.1 DUF551 domain-containing protein [Citrobacter freundii]MEB0616077.1 DUF551 domain-containing protein [Citrobacter freundii]MEB0691459.1 DUF551 domain-containing protein [Citrobacter freundii]